MVSHGKPWYAMVSSYRDAHGCHAWDAQMDAGMPGDANGMPDGDVQWMSGDGEAD